MYESMKRDEYLSLKRESCIQGSKLADLLAKTWLDANFMAFRATGQMHEKLRCDVLGGIGGGGEYVPQVGFGWSNGVVLALMHSYGYPPPTNSN